MHCSRALLPLALLLTMVRGGEAASPPSPSPPEVAARVTGPAQSVFDTRNGCEETDIPDQPARAFRDARNTVHLIASHSIARAMVGPSLDAVKHDCSVVYRSPRDRNPADFQYNNWLFSYYSLDGTRIAALVHSEFDADEIPGQCATPKDTNNCWWNTVTFAVSQDGGYSFAVPKPPGNLIAAIPYRYEVGNRSSAYGYTTPTNIVKLGAYYYALINDWPYKAQKFGPCAIRTANLFDPKSWRAWDGKDFTIRFVDPYREANFKPEEHVCAPVMPGEAESLLLHEPSGVFLITDHAADDRYQGPPGIYVRASRDLVHWSKAVLVVATADLRKADPPGKWSYDYVSLLDQSSTDRNFGTVGNTPYLYYVRHDENHPPYVRVLFRRRIQLSITAPPP